MSALAWGIPTYMYGAPWPEGRTGFPARTRKSGRPGSPGHRPAAAPDIHRWGAGYPRGLFQYNHPGPSPQ